MGQVRVRDVKNQADENGEKIRLNEVAATQNRNLIYAVSLAVVVHMIVSAFFLGAFR
jgi:hypothetical protein